MPVDENLREKDLFAMIEEEEEEISEGAVAPTTPLNSTPEPKKNKVVAVQTAAMPAAGPLLFFASSSQTPFFLKISLSPEVQALFEKMASTMIMMQTSGEAETTYNDTTAAFARYAAFIAANPSWPSIVTLRRRAEAMLWQERSDPTTVPPSSKTDPPHTAKGKFALARALLSQGDSGRAHQAISDAWRSDGFSADLEAQVRDMFAGLVTTEDDNS